MATPPRGAARRTNNPFFRPRHRMYVLDRSGFHQFFNGRRGVELTDKRMRQFSTLLSVKRFGKRYVGATTDHFDPKHEFEHVREIAFLDRVGFRRNSASILASLSEPFFVDTREKKAREKKSFNDIREFVKSVKYDYYSTQRGQTEWLNFRRSYVEAILSHFSSPLKKIQFVKTLFRSKRMRPLLEFLNKKSWETALVGEKKNWVKIEGVLIQLVDFAEAYAKAKNRRKGRGKNAPKKASKI